MCSTLREKARISSSEPGRLGSPVSLLIDRIVLHSPLSHSAFLGAVPPVCLPILYLHISDLPS